MQPGGKVWSTATAYGLVHPVMLKLWGRKGWTEDLAEAALYLSWEAAGKAQERNPVLGACIPVAIDLRIVEDSYKHVCAVRADYTTQRQKPLF